MKTKLVATAFFSILFINTPSITRAESETVKGAQKDYQNFKADMAVKLGDLDKQLSELKAKAKKSGDETQNEAIKNLEQTRTQLQTQLNTKVNEAQATTSQGWKQFKDSFAKSVDHLNTKIQKAMKD